MRVVQPDRLHRPEPQRIDAAFGHHLDRHAALEIGGVRLPFAKFGLFPREQTGVKCQVLLLGHRAVDVVLRFALIPAAGHPADVHVDGVAVDDGGDGIEKRQTVRAGRLPDAVSQRGGGQRPGGDDGEACGGQGVDPLAHDLQRRLRGEGGLDFGGEHVAVHRQRRSGGHFGLGRRRHHQRIELAHFVMEQADRVLFVVVGAEAVGADQFGQPRRLVRGAHVAAAAHFRQAHFQPAFRQLPCCFAAGQTAADDVNVICHAPPLTLARRNFQRQAWGQGI